MLYHTLSTVFAVLAVLSILLSLILGVAFYKSFFDIRGAKKGLKYSVLFMTLGAIFGAGSLYCVEPTPNKGFTLLFLVLFFLVIFWSGALFRFLLIKTMEKKNGWFRKFIPKGPWDSSQ